MRRNTLRAGARARFPAGLTGMAALAALALAGCGGGGGDDAGGSAATSQASAAPAPTSPTAAEPLLVNGLSQACAACGAATSSSYAGTDVGVWGYPNGSGAAVDVQYAISGVAGKSVWLQLYNTAAAAVAMPSGLSSRVAAEMISPQGLTETSDEEAMHRAIGEFNRSGWADAARPAGEPMRSTLAAPAPLAASLGTTAMGEGATRNWYHIDGTQRPATLRKQLAASDGTRVNLWVETAEAANVSDAMVAELGGAFAGGGMVYDRLVGLGGKLWGANAFTTSMLPAGMPVDIVVLNFNRDGKPYGTVGYFWGVHNFLKSKEANSNEAISLYLDSETMAAGTDGMRSVKTTMAHEGTHMQNFYRRQVSMGATYAYDTWLEEMTAMQMEDFVSAAISTSYNPIRDVRLADYYRYSDYNCDVTVFTGFGATCESYAVSGSLGGFLNRQLGVGFFRDLLARPTANSRQVLDEAIRASRPEWGFDQAMVNWRATTNSNMPLGRTPGSYGYPAWTDGTLTLPAIDPSAAGYLALRRLPATAPSMLQGNASYIAPRSPNTSGVYTDKVRVPAGVSLSVVVY